MPRQNVLIQVLRWLVVIVVLLAAPVLALAQDATATPNGASTDAGGLRRYQGDGYSLLLPAGASVVEYQPSSVSIAGPKIDIVDPATGIRYNHRAYALTIRTLDNPDALDAEAYVARLTAERWEALANGYDGPAGSLPFGRDGQPIPGLSEHVLIGGHDVFKVTVHSFDSDEILLYVTRGERVVLINYQDRRAVNDPLAAVQLDVYALILSTFQIDL